MTPPAGYKPLFRTSPFLDLLGPFYYRKDGEALIVGLYIAEKHANSRHAAHGGLLMTLSDIAIGYATAYSSDPPLKLVTTGLSADFAGSAKVGDWVEARVEVQKTGRRLAFANAYLYLGQDRIVRASATFLVVD